MKITKPTLLVDKKICENNIRNMAEKASNSNAELRPHFKTHHSAQIGEWFRTYGVKKCTASSVDMAKYFSEAGWDDITIAFPYNPLESEEISNIAANGNLNILIESEESLRFANELITNPVGYFIKLDMGTHRTGANPTNISLLEKLVSGSSEKVSFKGWLAHTGHTYISTPEETRKIEKESADVLKDLKSRFGGIISFGDTPSCSIVEDLSSYDEIRAGNYVFYDWMQKNIGSCKIEDIGVCLAAPIVSVHAERSEVVVYGGGVHLSKEVIYENDQKCFGKAVRLLDTGWDSEVIGNVRKLSQEHAVITINPEDFASMKVGDLIGMIPVHSCLAADLQGHYRLTTGERISKILKE